MMGIIPFLIQWMALNQFGSRHFRNRYYQSSSYPPKGHWTLLSELNQLSVEEIESFIPQMCNVVSNREALNNDEVFEYFEKIILNKCSTCFPFGIKVCNYLKVDF